MTALWIILAVALVLTVLNLLPVGVDAAYAEGAFSLAARIGPARLHLLPKAPDAKPGKARPKKPKKKKEKTKSAPPDAQTLLKLAELGLQALDRLRQTVKDAMSPHNTRDEFRQLLKAESINTVFRINPVGRVYGVTFIDHTNGIVANGSVLGREFSAGVFNELFPTSRKETLHTAEQHAERQYEQRSRTANPVSGVVDTLLDLVDARAFEEQQRIQRRRRKRKLHR